MDAQAFRQLSAEDQMKELAAALKRYIDQVQAGPPVAEPDELVSYALPMCQGIVRGMLLMYATTFSGLLPALLGALSLFCAPTASDENGKLSPETEALWQKSLDEWRAHVFGC